MEHDSIVIGLGAILILIGIIGGGFEIKEIKIPRVGMFPRILTGVVGITVFCLGAFSANAGSPSTTSQQTALTIDDMTASIKGISEHQPGSWKKVNGTEIPPEAYRIGSAPINGAAADLYLCRAEHNGNIFPGKVVSEQCNIPVGEDEVQVPTFEVLLASEGVSWASRTELPGRKLFVLAMNRANSPVLVCKALVHENYHPGIIKHEKCIVPYGRSSTPHDDFRVMVFDN